MGKRLLHGPLRQLLPLVTFPSLSALAVHFIWNRFIEANIGSQIGTQCHRDYTPPADSLQKSYFTPYTGFDAFDEAMCPLVTFFDALINCTDTLPFLTYAIATSLPLVLIPNVEAHRKGQSCFLAYPVIFGLLSQVVSVGVIFPIYWLVFILTGGPQKTAESPLLSYTKAHAEALIFGIFTGAVIPSVAMLIMNDFHITAIWQFYPVLVAVAQFSHLQFRPSSQFSSSGYDLLRMLYIGCFITSSSSHISTIWPMVADFSAIKEFLTPSLTPLPYSSSLSLHLLESLKWDITFAYSSTALGMLWFSNNLKELVTIILWYSVAIPLLGFAAAVTGVAIWNEGIMAQ
ncbi:hypothetical protein HYPSUDRAFT_35377 [Hypholoma sublateritium FD-334 SS-4]|uniref:Uncharacterized protein n=1 Tax=Hypholoma sublateritium (strain FD-334 SS-4) TaxID=945553 RepID=A0A0D2Q6U3_HYPSF|nr:hypothetical protein HYPSUDRAFT_35377 [Hypholoma sublateritium FD-334 SS-4]